METATLTFARSWVLQALWLLPLFAALFWWAEARRKAVISRIVAPRLKETLAGNASPFRRWFRSACVLVAFALLIAALAGPRLGYDTIEVPHRGRDVIIAMDVSRSMLAPDVVPSRLDRAKLLAQDLISELEGDRIGLVAFAGSSFLQAPLTLDRGAVLTALDELDTDVIPKGGSNLAEAIGTSEEAFGKAEGFSRAIVIMSDGEELSADAVSAAKRAALSGIKIFTVGIGSAEGALIPDPQQSGEFVQDPATGKIVTSKLDENRLREIAEASGGFYTILDDTAAAKLSAEGIGRLEEADIAESSSRRPIERYQWPLGAAIALLMLQSIVGERRRRAAVLIAFFCLAHNVSAAPAGIEAYESQQYDKALEAFEERLHWEPDDASLQINVGSAAYRMGDHEKALKFFSSAALSKDAQISSRADFSFANTLFQRGLKQEEKDKKIADWKQAIAKYDTALKTLPDYAEAKANKERVEQLLKELEKEQKQEQQQQQKNKDERQKQNRQQDQQQKEDKQDQKQNRQQDQQQQQSGEQKDQQKQQQQKQDNQQSGSGQGQDGKQDQQQEKNEQQKKQDQQQNPGEQKDEQQKQGESGEEEQKQNEQPQKQNQNGSGEKQDEEKKDQGKQGQTQQDQEQKDGEQKKQDQSSNDGDSRPQQPQPEKDRENMPQRPQEKKEGELRGAAGADAKEEGDPPNAAAAVEKVEEGKMSQRQALDLLRRVEKREEGKVNLNEQQDLQEVSKDW